jgi:protein-S-isoprenylcysteine O-methyltransferase Ste14
MIYQIISVLLVMIFYFIFFFKVFKLKKKGIKVNHLGKGSIKTKDIKKSEQILKVFVILMMVIQFLSIIIDDNWYYVYTEEYIKIIGICIILISICTLYLSITIMKDNFRVGIDLEENKILITSGIYKYSRNPNFLAFDLLYIGLTMIFCNPINLIFTIILIFMFDEQIKIEEQVLYIQFSDEYKSYCSKVKRYFLFF